MNTHDDSGQFIDGPQGRLFVDDGGAGDATPVVFVHSAAGSTAHWVHQLAHLRRTRRAVALDLRGHGRSAPPANGDHGIRAMADDIQAVADRLRLSRFVLVGHSQGGAVAAAYAGVHPERLAGLVLLDPASDARRMPPEQAAELMAGLRSAAYQDLVESYWQTQLAGAPPAARDQVMAGLRATPRQTVVGSLGSLLAFDPLSALAHYAGPRLAIITALNETPDALHLLVPGMPHQKISGTGHWLQLDAPDQVNAALDRFLAAVP